MAETNEDSQPFEEDDLGDEEDSDLRHPPIARDGQETPKGSEEKSIGEDLFGSEFLSEDE